VWPELPSFGLDWEMLLLPHILKNNHPSLASFLSRL
jgi:hypothetical protein